MSTPIPNHLRLALRRPLRSPTTSALAVLMLAFGSGAHVAIFGLIHSLFLAPLPFPQVERLIGVYQSRSGEGFYPLSFPDYLDLRNGSTTFDVLAAHYPSAPMSLSAGARRIQINGAVVSASYFGVLGVAPVRGRFFSPEEDEIPQNDPVAVISHGFWQSYFAGEDDVVGRTLDLNGVEFTIIGVAEELFRGVFQGAATQVWIPTMMGRVGYRWCDLFERDCTWLNLIGRLKRSRTLENARAELGVIAARLNAAHRPLVDVPPGFSSAPLERVHPQSRARLLRLTSLLLLSVTLLVVVVAANLGSLILARTLERVRETAILLAMGAGRARVLLAVVSETLLLSLAGGALGLLLAVWLGRAVAALFPGGAYLDLGIRPAFVGYALALALLNCLLVAFAPALQATRPDLVPALRGVTAGAGPRRPSALGALVVLQVALSVVLLVSSALILKSLWRVDRPGDVDPRQIATLRLRPRLVGYQAAPAQAFTRTVLDRVAGLPEVESVTAADLLPPGLGETVELARRDQRGSPGAARSARLRNVTPRFFEVFGLQILRGRDFVEADNESRTATSIVSESVAQRLWPDRHALGESLVVEGRSVMVVGVVQNESVGELKREGALHVYMPYWQDSSMVDARLAARTSGDSAVLLQRARRLVAALDHSVPVTELATMSDRLALLSAPTRLAGHVMGFSGLVALALSAAGLFGVLSLNVARRTREIGIRIAVGATERDTVRLIVLGALRQVAIALGIGIVAAALSTPLLDEYLYGVGPHDPLSIGSVVLVVNCVAAIAAWFPARRAARLDPLVALRDE